MKFLALATAVFPILAANAANITIQVGNGGLVFNPTNVTANVGDNLLFTFVSGNHSVTQSTFASPCQKSGIDSGFMNVVAGAAQNPQWTVQVNDTSTPLWFFCQQTTPKNHCQNGMVFAVNPTADKSFAAFQQAAMASGNSTATPSGSGSASAPAASGTGAPAASGSASGGASAPAASGSGTPAASGTSSAASTSQSSTSNNNSGVKMAGSVASLLAVAGLVAGLAF